MSFCSRAFVVKSRVIANPLQLRTFASSFGGKGRSLQSERPDGMGGGGLREGVGKGGGGRGRVRPSEKEKERHRQTQADRQADGLTKWQRGGRLKRERDRQTDRQRDRQRDRDREKGGWGEYPC